MANQTVYPYGTGGSLPSSIGLINDLVTGGVDKALTAQQGVVLKGMIDSAMAMIDVAQDGFYIVDPSLNIGFAFDGETVFPSGLKYQIV